MPAWRSSRPASRKVMCPSWVNGGVGNSSRRRSSSPTVARSSLRTGSDCQAVRPCRGVSRQPRATPTRTRNSNPPAGSRALTPGADSGVSARRTTDVPSARSSASGPAVNAGSGVTGVSRTAMTAVGRTGSGTYSKCMSGSRVNCNTSGGWSGRPGGCQRSRNRPWRSRSWGRRSGRWPPAARGPEGQGELRPARRRVADDDDPHGGLPERGRVADGEHRQSSDVDRLRVKPLDPPRRAVTPPATP